MNFPSSELVLNDKGQVYHLSLLPENISEKIIIVGDQDRVALVSNYFDSIEYISQHREFVCHTGYYNEKRITVLSTGIGTDNIDIVINELDALVNIDLKKRVAKDKHTTLDIVRIGTCGILQPEIPVHSWILSSHGFGLDNIAHFYDIPFETAETMLCKEIEFQIQPPKGIAPYLISGDEIIFNRLLSENVFTGITITSSGFYGPQGRQLRLRNKHFNLNEALTNFKFEDYRITNFEMETSALFALGRGLGHRTGTICLGVANRPVQQFSKGYNDEMMKLIEYVLHRI
jgi:uridine phosphorylase